MIIVLVGSGGTGGNQNWEENTNLPEMFKGSISSLTELNAQFHSCNEDTMMLVHEEI
jgi:hypothetical protein